MILEFDFHPFEFLANYVFVVKKKIKTMGGSLDTGELNQ